MNAFKVTYKDGTSYTTSANGTAAEFKAYLCQDGGRIVHENPVTGEETVRYIDTVEDVTKYSIYIETNGKWSAVRPTGGKPYTWTKAEAQHQRESLYPFVFDGIKVDVAGK